MDIQNLIWNFLFIFARVVASFVFVPLLHDSIFPRIIKGALCFLFSIILVPYAYSHFSITTPTTAICIINIITNILIGCGISFILTTPFWIMEGVGNIIDVQRGVQFGATVNLETKSQSSMLGTFLSQFFLTYFLINNGILLYLQVIFNSFDTFGLSGLLLSKLGIVYGFIDILSFLCKWSVVLVIPPLILMLVVDVILGVASSFVKKLHVTEISMPLKTCVATIVLIIYLQPLSHTAFRLFNQLTAFLTSTHP